MDFPIFHLDLFGNRLIIATIATLHVLINHGLAVGMMPLVAIMEWHGHRSGDQRWDRLGYRILFFCFLITTTIGAMTGVGIWLSASLINPYAIASLIRVFFWAWFTEWLVFITEVCLIVAYFLTWKKWSEGAAKKRHIRFGFALGFFSWVTMAIIVSILGFMMDPGSWLSTKTLFSGFTNPIYLPQLAFRTPLALTMAGVISGFLCICFTKRGDTFRAEALRAINLWTLFWTPMTLAGGWWYISVVPSTMKDNIGTALLTMQFEAWQGDFYKIIIATIATVYLVAQISVLRPTLLPRAAYLVACLAIVWLTGHFERVREFIRKPYVIGQYMYANGIRVGDYPLLQRDGVLAHSTYSYPLSAAETAGLLPADRDKLQHGKDVFLITCSRCHTGNGVNSVVTRFQDLMGNDKWDRTALADWISGMHEARAYMPPFPGTKEELLWLADYINHLHETGLAVAGAQESGVTLNPLNKATAVRVNLAPGLGAADTGQPTVTPVLSAETQ